MSDSRKHQVNLRGASAKEITRDALLEKVNQERELRNYMRRANAAVLLIQRGWRRHHDTKTAALRIQKDWEVLMKNYVGVPTRMMISSDILRPFLFFVEYLCVRYGKIGDRERDCMISCFRVMLEGISANDVHHNFCSMTTGSCEEKKIWFLQTKKLISICLFILSVFGSSCQRMQDVVLTSMAMRLAVVLTDPNGWKCTIGDGFQDAFAAVRSLMQYVGNKTTGLYHCIRTYFYKLEGPFFSQKTLTSPTDDRFLIVASAVTLLLRPFHVANLDSDDNGLMESAIEQYCILMLTIPWFPQRLPSVLVPALRHKSVLSPCLRTFLISKEKILREISGLDQLKVTSKSKIMPGVGWALANIVYLSTNGDVSSVDSGKFPEGLDCASYLHLTALLIDNLLDLLGNFGWIKGQNREIQGDDDNTVESFQLSDEMACRFSSLSYMDHFRPVYQQWHLHKLLTFEKYTSVHGADNIQLHNQDYSWNFEILNVAYFYSSMIRLFSAVNPSFKSLPILNMLSFTPGFLSSLWGELEKCLFPSESRLHSLKPSSANMISGRDGGVSSNRQQKRFNRENSSKLMSVLHKISGKSVTDNDHVDSRNSLPGSHQTTELSSDEWDVEILRLGPEGITKDLSCLLHLFCSCYSHLLMVLDDTEFYDKQVPFNLEQQKKIASLVNTLAYNTFSQNTNPRNQPLVESTVRCLHLLYERDCRRQFCPPDLWLSPGKVNRMPIAVAARTHEFFSSADAMPSSSIGSVITTMPHVFPFDERVKMFRELISMDKISRRMAGEITSPGSQSIEIVIRRSHVFEDGLRQLNNLGPRLKSAIHVSFVSESGLPEAGLDYGGLSKELLTDISKAAFSPEYGLFLQSSTSERLLVPNISARFLENGIRMIEFLGRIVGKALYEGILLDFYFSHVFVQKLLGRYSFLDELSILDPELYRNLMYVKHYDGDVEELCLDFTVTEEALGKRHVIELKPGGKDCYVTNENKLQYLHAMADYKLNRQMLPFSNAFYRGLTDLISPSWLKLFNASEFNQLLSGGDHDIDVDDLRKHTQYTGGYSDGSRTVKLFWEVVAGFQPEERCMLLKFVTSCSRAPLLGFKHLQPAFTIHKVVCDVPLWATFGGQDVDRLPSASTCYNTLKLPTYKRSSTLRAKLLYAINSNAGFELS